LSAEKEQQRELTPVKEKNQGKNKKRGQEKVGSGADGYISVYIKTFFGINPK
jgi:hypothetical protein